MHVEAQWPHHERETPQQQILPTFTLEVENRPGLPSSLSLSLSLLHPSRCLQHVTQSPAPSAKTRAARRIRDALRALRSPMQKRKNDARSNIGDGSPHSWKQKDDQNCRHAVSGKQAHHVRAGRSWIMRTRKCCSTSTPHVVQIRVDKILL